MRAAIKKCIPYALGKKLRGLWQKSMAVYYRGDNYLCPYCGHRFRKMLPGGFDLPVIQEKSIIGGGRRKNNVCPRCYATDRDRLIYLYLKFYTDILNKAIKLFHVAPAGALKAFLARQQNIEYIQGTKHHDGSYYYAKNIQLLDITNLNFKDNSFDVIICNHVLEHIEDDAKAIKELYRVMKPGGRAILQVPISQTLEVTYEDFSIIDPKEREKRFGQFDHVRIYGKDYTQRIENGGFKVEILNPIKDNWNIKDLEKYAINPEENIFIAHK